MDRWPTVLLFGAPGSGKGTQAQFLCALAPFVHISTGELFRTLAQDSPLAHKVQTYISQGSLVPDELTLELWREHVQRLIHTRCFDPAKQHLLLDGLPRTQLQAQLLEAHVRVELILELKVRDEEALIARLVKRSLQQGRSDDAQPEIIRNRLRVYKEQTQSVLQHYPADRIVTIDAQQPPLMVLHHLLPALQQLLSGSGR